MLRVLVKLAVVHSPNNSNIFTCNVISNVPKGIAFLGRMAQILKVFTLEYLITVQHHTACKDGQRKKNQ